MTDRSLEKNFEALFEHAPEVVGYAPGRVNIIGDHTDYNEGFVLPAAIQMGTSIAASRRDDNQICAFAERFTHTIDQFSLDTIKFCHNEMWRNYVRGTLQCLRQHSDQFSGMNLYIAGNVPQGAGLSSSASFEIALLKTVADLYSLDLAGVDAALIGQRAENSFVGCNCGIMDQLVSAMGLENHAMLLDCRDLRSEDAPLPAEVAILVVNSNVKRGLVDSEYNSRRAQCEAVAQTLGVSALRDLCLDQLHDGQSILSDEQFRRARHVITENYRTVEAMTAMQANNLYRLGRLMAESHASLRDDYQVSTSALDGLVEIMSTAMGARGGARMTGGGFGGCVVGLMPEQKVAEVTAAVQQMYPKRTGLTADIYQCTASMGAFRKQGID